MQYFFVLGKNPGLSSAEIISVLEREKIKYTKIAHSSEALIIKTTKKISPEFMDELGGTIKMGQILSENFDEQFIFQALKNKYQEKKLIFGASFYKLENTFSNKKIEKKKKEIEQFFYSLKKELKSEEISCRMVTSREKNLSSVVVSKNKILEKGMEFCFFISENLFFVGETLAVQKFEEYSFRDWQRPAKDLVSGMLPPKVAKILINLAQCDKEKSLLDPFCGSGTILQEAAVLGYKNVFGSDISEKAIIDSQKNLEWVNRFFMLEHIPQIFVLNASNLSDKFGEKSIDSIATEPLLGPPQRGSEGRNDLKRIILHLESLYLEFFLSAEKILKPSGKIAIIFPSFSIQKYIFNINILAEVEKMGFKIKEWPNFIETNDRGGLIYFRPDQKVYREIFVFEKI